LISNFLLSSRTRIIVYFALFASTALLLLTGPSPAVVLALLRGASHGVWSGPQHRELLFSLVADCLAWIVCIVACLMVFRLAQHLRDHVNFGLTTYVLVLFTVCFGIQRVIGYLMWSPLQRLHSELQIVRAASSVILAMGVAILLPYVRSMLQAVAAANREREQFIAAAESSLDAFYIYEPVRNAAGDIEDFRFAYVNAIGEKRLRKSRSELIGRSLGEVVPYVITAGILARMIDVIRTGYPWSDELVMERKEGGTYWVHTQVVKLRDGLAVTTRDITEERNRQVQIAKLSDFTQSMIESAPFSIIATDPAGTVIAMNPAAEALTLYRKHELIGQHSMVMLHDTGEMSARSVQLSKDLALPISAGFTSLIAKPRQGQTDEHEWTYIRKDGSRIWVNLAMTALKTPEDKITGYLGIAFDITERKKLTEYVNHLAHHDQLTGLPNRVLLLDRIRQAIQRARRHGHKVAVFMVDIDQFKRINDSLGHSAGDSLLDSVAKKLCSAVRQTDTVARMGGDEFVIVMPELREERDAERVAETIIRKVGTPTLVGNREVNVTVSVGLCIFPDCARDADTLLKNADAAMYEAKESGRNSHHVFNEGMIDATADKLEFEHDLRHALSNGELSLHYQPQVSCISGDVIGMEALLRWNHPKRGSIAPGQFIPLAEATGLIVPMGEWAIRMACHEGRELQQTLGREIVIAVNLSARQFRQKNLSALVEAALRESRLPPRSLEIEITEHTLMSNTTLTNHTLTQLRKLGVKIAIDDFGTGFSSFSYLLQYEVDRLKIDRSFVNRSADDPTAAAIVRAIISMAHGLNLKVVAEGVENSEQLNFLLRRRCDEAQGFFFGRPVPAALIHESALSIARRATENTARAMA
jgi:diguanylate cyclase (GGDEF)-like protein/PAS domain S-box-containing protein